jgi:ribitol-5-phosphate 2-dehydrogenase
MLNAVYRLVEPRHFEVEWNDIDLTEDMVLVRPTYLSICNADQRYYQGKRPAEVLAQKLPMALIHEGIGEVVMDTRGEFAPGQKVVMIPNTPYEEDEFVAENYLRSSKFRASGFDGFMQDTIAMRRDRIVLLPDGIDPHVAAFTEFTSVCYHAVGRFLKLAHARRDRIGIWGDGNLAFAIALILKYREPGAKLYIFGKHEEKLANFSFAEETYHINDIPDDVTVDHAFECVGSSGAPKAINQIIDYIAPEGTISLLGVTEELAPLNTRMILEKGLRLFGSSRSGRGDFENTVKMYTEHPEMVRYLECLVDNIIEVNDMQDFVTAFEADIHKAGGKTVMHWNK